ncbi:MAG: formate dehydrogenase subunit alpha [Phycisphaeraceae bacterium]|nr:formate dehydrogenase subunit alpha [Phycisphaeraceae bacterium]
MISHIQNNGRTVSITIDGQQVEIPEDATVLTALRSIGKDVPTLCYSDRMKPYGACRTCLIEVEGGKPVAACHTPVQNDRNYITQSPLLTRLRRNITELVVSDHPLECLDCTANGRCDLQSLAQQVGLRTPRYENPRTHNPPKDDSHPFIKLEMAKCIGCAKCVRACDEVQGSFILGMSGRGYDVKVIAGNDTGFEDANCVSCGQCVVECPVAALEEPGTRDFGLPDNTVNTTCSYCGVGCSLDVNVKDGQVINIVPSKQGSANLGHTCVKGRFAHQFAHSTDRLRTPLIKDKSGSFQEATWDTALDLIAMRFTELRENYGPAGFSMISSSRCTNEENFLMQKFARVVMGTNSIDNCSRVCHSPSSYALGQALGTGAGTNSFQDVHYSDVLLIVGANPTEAHPVFGARIKQSVLAGCKLIILDPRNTELAGLSDVHLPLRPGSNVAVINALQHVLIEEDLIDPQFIAQHTEGFELVKKEMSGCTPQWASQISSVNSDLIRQAARLYASGKASQILWGLGVTEAGHGSNAAFGLINMAVMTGNIGRPGPGASPIRGQNNVQGASDVGALPNVFCDYRSVTDTQARADHKKIWGVEPPTNTGLRIPDMFDASHHGTLKGMYILAEDVAQSDPNTSHVVGSLENLEFMVVQEIFMNPTAELADVVLPGTTFLEKDGTFCNSDRRIQRVRKAIEPLTGTMVDGDITNAIARRMGVDLGFDSGPDTLIDPSKIMDEIAALSPKWAGVSYERLEQLGFIQWPCWDKDHPGTDIVHRNGEFLSGKAKLTPTPWQEPGELPDDQYPLMLTTGRQLFHYNVGTMTRRTDVSKLHKAKEETLRIHPKDARRLEIRNGEQVNVISRHGHVCVRAEVTKATNPGTVFMTFHFPESRTNLVISSAMDEYTGCPEYKVNAVRIEKVSSAQNQTCPDIPSASK